MGYLSFYFEEKYSTCNNMSGNPTKKMRLDAPKFGERNAVNDDLWGQDDLTAEEFDMLEIQATQSCNQVTNNQNHVHNSSHNFENDISKVNDLKLQQYELEGRVKLLSQSLDKSTKELNEERLNRQKIINNLMKEYYERENALQKEIEKMRSILEFKDQEMKSTYSKLQVMKTQIKDKKESNAENLLTKNFQDFLKSSKSNICDGSYNFNVPKAFQRKHKLEIDCSKGETKNIDLLSSILCNRLVIPSFSSSENTLNHHHSEDLSSNSFSSLSIVQLKEERKCGELLEHYCCFLKNHVAKLKSLSSKSSNVASNKSLPKATKLKEFVSCTVISVLSDTGFLLSCPRPVLEECELKRDDPSSSTKVKDPGDLITKSLSHCINQKDSSVGLLARILEPLFALTNPETYPVGYSKKDEIELSLSAVLSVCLSYDEVIMDLDLEPPIHSLKNPHQSVTAVCMTLKLMTALCHHKKFLSFLTHKSDDCILCLIGTFMVNIVPQYPVKFSSSFILMENFLSTIFSIPDLSEIHLETSHCISNVIQGIIKSLLKYYQLKDCDSRIQILKKGFLLLHTLSSCISNFKERRNPVEDEYILLITSILAMSKEFVDFREFYDLAHSLWDFQTDTTEFDLDDLPEETQSSTNKTEFSE